MEVDIRPIHLTTIEEMIIIHGKVDHIISLATKVLSHRDQIREGIINLIIILINETILIHQIISIVLDHGKTMINLDIVTSRIFLILQITKIVMRHSR